MDPKDWDSAEMSRLSISNSSSRFVETVTNLNGVARMLAIVAKLFVGLLATIARARGIT